MCNFLRMTPDQATQLLSDTGHDVTETRVHAHEYFNSNLVFLD